MELYGAGRPAEAARGGGAGAGGARSCWANGTPVTHGELWSNQRRMHLASGDHARAPLLLRVPAARVRPQQGSRPPRLRLYPQQPREGVRTGGGIRQSPAVVPRGPSDPPGRTRYTPPRLRPEPRIAGNAVRVDGEYAKAAVAALDSRDLRESLGENHPDYARCLSNSRNRVQGHGEYAKCLPLYVQALDVLKVGLGEAPPTTRTILTNLARPCIRRPGIRLLLPPLYRQVLELRKVTCRAREPP